MSEAFDVVIVGGGVVGSAIAYFLANDDGFRGRVAVVERDPTYRTASSALSGSSIRQQYSTEINVLLSRFGIGFLRQVGTLLEVAGEQPSIGLVEPGYLFLADDRGLPVLQANHEFQRGMDVAVALLSPEDVQARFPWMDVAGVRAGSLGLANEGWFDGYGLLQAFRRKARSLGAVYIEGNVVALEREGARIEAVMLADGRRLACGTVVNAAGPRARSVAEMAGVTLPVEARRRSVFVLDARASLPGCPLVIDVSGVWFRPEGAHFLCGVSPPDERDAENFELEVEHDLFEETIWPALAARVPAFEAVKVVSAWAGHYEMNVFDHNGIVGRHPELANMICANGFSGHGLQQSPAVGRGVAELIVHGGYRSLDLTPLSPARIAANRPLLELNII